MYSIVREHLFSAVAREHQNHRYFCCLLVGFLSCHFANLRCNLLLLLLPQLLVQAQR